jgi:hypothetical protein
MESPAGKSGQWQHGIEMDLKRQPEIPAVGKASDPVGLNRPLGKSYNKVKRFNTSGRSIA